MLLTAYGKGVPVKAAVVERTLALAAVSVVVGSCICLGCTKPDKRNVYFSAFLIVGAALSAVAGWCLFVYMSSDTPDLINALLFSLGDLRPTRGWNVRLSQFAKDNDSLL